MTHELTSPPSHAIFESFCQRAGIPFQQIHPDGTRPSPDYLLNDAPHQVIVEVKEIRPNRREDRLLASLDREESITFFDNSMHRLRSKIRKASRQIRPARD